MFCHCRLCKEEGKSLPWVLEKLKSRPTPKRKVKVKKKVVRKNEEGEEEEVEEETEVEVVPFVSADLPEDDDDDAEFDPSAEGLEEDYEDDRDSVATSSVGGASLTPMRTPNADADLTTPKYDS